MKRLMRKSVDSKSRTNLVFFFHIFFFSFSYCGCFLFTNSLLICLSHSRSADLKMPFPCFPDYPLVSCVPPLSFHNRRTNSVSFLLPFPSLFFLDELRWKRMEATPVPGSATRFPRPERRETPRVSNPAACDKTPGPRGTSGRNGLARGREMQALKPCVW